MDSNPDQLRQAGIDTGTRIVLGVQYDGAPWAGWQTQLHGNTVQDVLERALARFAQHDIATTCAGRTDAGVHALGQVVHFDTALKRDTFAWVRGVNSYLPSSIAVRWRISPMKRTREISAAGNSAVAISVPTTACFPDPRICSKPSITTASSAGARPFP